MTRWADATPLTVICISSPHFAKNQNKKTSLPFLPLQFHTQNLGQLLGVERSTLPFCHFSYHSLWLCNSHSISFVLLRQLVYLSENPRLFARTLNKKGKAGGKSHQISPQYIVKILQENKKKVSTPSCLYKLKCLNSISDFVCYCLGPCLLTNYKRRHTRCWYICIILVYTYVLLKAKTKTMSQTLHAPYLPLAFVLFTAQQSTC